MVPGHIGCDIWLRCRAQRRSGLESPLIIFDRCAGKNQVDPSRFGLNSLRSLHQRVSSCVLVVFVELQEILVDLVLQLDAEAVNHEDCELDRDGFRMIRNL